MWKGAPTHKSHRRFLDLIIFGPLKQEGEEGGRAGKEALPTASDVTPSGIPGKLRAEGRSTGLRLYSIGRGNRNGAGIFWHSVNDKGSSDQIFGRRGGLPPSLELLLNRGAKSRLEREAEEAVKIDVPSGTMENQSVTYWGMKEKS